MKLEWSDHSSDIVTGVSSLYLRQKMLDITLAAEGRYLRAHKLVLVSVSQYFEDMLVESSVPQDPIIFFRDVKYRDLENIVRFIYSGSVEIQGASLDSFLEIAASLGITGFNNKSENSSRKKLFQNKIVEDVCDKENVAPGSSRVLTSSTSINTPSKLVTPRASNTSHSKLSSGKKRKIVSKGRFQISDDSVGGMNDTEKITVNKTSTKETNEQKQQSEPIYTNINCENSPRNNSSKTSPKNKESSQSFDSHFLDPDELAAKGATLLHHLAVWMIQQNKSDVDSDLIKHYQAVSDEMPAPNINKFSDKKDSPHKHSRSLPVPRQYLANTQQQSSARTPLIKPGIADTDRPDSGFDPKDDIEEEDGGNKHEDDEDKSPEIKEMSRQALARQPVMKKKRILNK